MKQIDQRLRGYKKNKILLPLSIEGEVHQLITVKALRIHQMDVDESTVAWNVPKLVPSVLMHLALSSARSERIKTLGTRLECGQFFDSAGGIEMLSHWAAISNLDHSGRPLW